MIHAETPLFTALQQHAQHNRSSFHTPGHKNNPLALPKTLFELDFTELPDTDSLYEASGPILAAEQHAAKVLGTKRTLFSAGGCTLCIQAMLRLATRSGKQKIIASRILHRSAVNAMALLDLHPTWISPRQSAGSNLPGRIHPEDVADALNRCPDAAAVYLTSPDYFGVLSPISEIAAVCRSHQIPLLVDNAHGAHLFFCSQKHPLEQGASMSADSPHKTLPVLTGGAWLNIADPQFVPHAKDAMALFGSTSPAYPTMASLDLCAAWLETNGRTAYSKLEARVARLRNTARSLGFTLPLGDCDPTRLTLRTGQLSIPGQDLAETFRSHGIEPEYWDDRNVVLIPTPFNTEEDFLRLEHAMHFGAALPKQTFADSHPPLPALPEMVLSPRQAMFQPWEEIPLESSVHRIAAEAACPCPPGVPVVMPGERITKEVTEFLHRYRFSSVKVVK